jgi:predicted metallopeptidase
MSGTSDSALSNIVRHWKMSRARTEIVTPNGFRLSEYLHLLTTDIVQRVPEFSHLKPDQMLFSVTRARKRSQYGLQARVTPMRFRDGSLTKRIRNTTYQVQRYFVEKTEILYLVTFCVPRFLDQSFSEKLITIFHELYHISPDFNGDLRRMEGRYELHTHSKEGYDDQMALLVQAYLATKPSLELLNPLRLNSNEFRQRYAGVLGYCIPQPKMLPVRDLQVTA